MLERGGASCEVAPDAFAGDTPRAHAPGYVEEGDARGAELSDSHGDRCRAGVRVARAERLERPRGLAEVAQHLAPRQA